MTSPSSQSKRRRVAWIVGVVVLIGVAALVVGNWDGLYVWHHTRRFRVGVESGPIGGHNDVTWGDYNTYTDEVHEMARTLAEYSIDQVPKIVNLLNHDNPYVQCASAEVLLHIEDCPDETKTAARKIKKQNLDHWMQWITEEEDSW